MPGKGIFTDEFGGAFEDVLGDVFDFGFPAGDGALPDPQALVEDVAAPGLANQPVEIGGGPAELPDVVEAVHADLPTAVSVDYGPLAIGKPGGSDSPGGPKGGSDGGGGGGGGKKGGVTPYTSGAADADGVDNFNIYLEFSGDYSSAAATALVGYLKASADFLSNIITTGLTDDPGMFREGNTRKTFLVDDIYIEIKLGNLGPLVGAETGIYAGNDWNGNGTPETFYGATMTFNSLFLDGLEANGTLDDVALHEMLHALGFGLWEVAENDLTDGTQYTGAGANGYLLEDAGGAGSVGTHWQEATYDAELMTSIIEDTDVMYLDDASIASLADLRIINHDGSTGYQLASDWQAQIDVLNASGGTDGGIDLDAWALAVA